MAKQNRGAGSPTNASAQDQQGEQVPNEGQAPTATPDPSQGRELKAVRKSDLPQIIYFDDKDNDVERKEFARDHAINLVALQHQKGYKNWTISPGQNLDVKDGKIVSAGTSGNAEE